MYNLFNDYLCVIMYCLKLIKCNHYIIREQPTFLFNFENTNNYLQLVEEQIKNKCQHNYVTDDIDIDPDKSMKICYCTICEKGL